MPSPKIEISVKELIKVVITIGTIISIGWGVMTKANEALLKINDIHAVFKEAGSFKKLEK